MIQPIKSLKRHYILNLCLRSLDILSRICLLEVVALVLLAWVYGSHPVMSNFRILFLTIVLILQIPLVIWLIKNIQSISRLSFKKFIYQFEELNADLLKNEASVLVDGDSSPNLVKQYYLDSTAHQLKSQWHNTRVLALHPFRFLLSMSIFFVVMLTILKLDQKSRLLLAFYDLTGSSEVNLTMLIQPEKAYLQGTSFSIKGEVFGEPLFPVELHIRNKQDQLISSIDVEQLEWLTANHFKFNSQSEGSNEDLWIQAKSGSQQSDPVLFRMVEFPQITDIKVTVISPDYAGANEEHYGGVPFSILQSSVVNLNIGFNKSLSEIKLEPATASFQITSSTTGKRINLKAKLHTDQSIRINFRGEDGFEDNSPWYKFKIHKDQLPVVRILKPNVKLEIAKGILDQINLSLDVKDDLGLTKLGLNYKVRQRFEMNYISSADSLILTDVTGTRVSQNIVANLPTLYMQEGDTLSYQVLAWDKHPSHGPGYSSTHFVNVPYAFEEHEKAEKETQQMVENLEEIKEDQQESEFKVKRMQQEKAQTSRKISSEQQQQLKELMLEKQEMQKKAEELEQKLNATLQKERENQLLDEGTLMKMEQVRDLYQNIMQDMREQMKALENMTRNAPKLNNQQMQNMLQKFDKNKFSDELDRTLKSLQKVQAKRKLNKNLKRLEKLHSDHKQMQNLMAQNRQVSTTNTDLLKKDFESINKELKELSKDKNLAPELRQQLENISQNGGDELRKKYEQMNQALNEGKLDQTAKHNSQIQNELQKMIQDIKTSNQKSQQQIMKVDLDQLNLFLRETLLQSQFIKNVDHEIDFLEGLPLKRYAAREFSFLDSSVKNLGNQIKEAYKANLNFQSVILRIVEMLEDKIHETVDFFAADRPRTMNQPIHQVFRFNNQLTAILINLKDQLEQQRQSMDLSQYLESLQDISEQQQQINQQTQQLDQMIQRQKDMALQQQMMQQLAFQQQLVRKSTEKLFEQYRNKAELAQNLGQVSQKMREVEKHLQDGQTAQETQDKQKKIEYKLLEAQQAMKQQQEGKKRKALISKKQTTEDQKSGSDISESEQTATQEILRRKNIPRQYKGIIQTYFNQLQ